MFYYDGKEWKKNKYKVTYQAVVYTDEPDRYQDATVEEVVLSDEQELRYAEVRLSRMTGNDFMNYVMNGYGLPDHRTDIEKLIDLIPAENLTEDVIDLANRLKASSEVAL